MLVKRHGHDWSYSLVDLLLPLKRSSSIKNISHLIPSFIIFQIRSLPDSLTQIKLSRENWNTVCAKYNCSEIASIIKEYLNYSKIEKMVSRELNKKTYHHKTSTTGHWPLPKFSITAAHMLHPPASRDLRYVVRPLCVFQYNNNY